MFRDQARYGRDPAVVVRTKTWAEPLLGPLSNRHLDGLEWLVVGGESRPDWRPVDLGWVRPLRDRCRAAGVPFYLKQLNGLYPGRTALLDGKRYAEMPPIHTPPLP